MAATKMIYIFAILLMSVFQSVLSMSDYDYDIRPKSFGGSTSKTLEESFNDLCTGYRYPKGCQQYSKTGKECDALYGKFLKAFQWKNPNRVFKENYTAFAVAATHEVPQYDAILYEGVKDFVQPGVIYKGRRMFEIANTLSGKIGNLTWCGQTADPGFLFPCPGDEHLPFWERISMEYAKQLSGTVYAILNGSRPGGAVASTSVFSNYELPNLNPNKVDKLHALIVHDVGRPVVEKCDDGDSLDKLKKRVKGMGITYQCTDASKDLVSMAPGTIYAVWGLHYVFAGFLSFFLPLFLFSDINCSQ